MQLDFTRTSATTGTERARRLPQAKPAPRRRKKAEAAPHWERGYRSHFYRNERGEKLGEVRLSDRGDMPVVYHWAAGNYSGAEGSLAHARMRVEETIGFGTCQLALF
ncbi:hypothetical protein ACU4HD_34275 [Cupriavidus basilensis]